MPNTGFRNCIENYKILPPYTEARQKVSNSKSLFCSDGKSRGKVLLWLRFCEPISTSSSALGQKYYQISQYYFYHSLWPLLHLPCLIVVEASSNSPSFVLTQTDGLPLIQEMHFLEKKADKALHQFSAAGILPSFPATVASRKKYPRPNMDKRGRGIGSPWAFQNCYHALNRMQPPGKKGRLARICPKDWAPTLR